MSSTQTRNAVKYVYDFAEGSRDMRDLLGGKGANLAEMTRLLGAELVPAGFTITTEACVDYMRAAASRPGWRAGRGGARRLEGVRASSSATPAIRCCCPCAPDRASQCPE